MDEPSGCMDRLWCCIPVYTSMDGRVELPTSPRTFKVLATAVLLFVFVLGLLIGWWLSTMSAQRLIDAADDAAVEGVGITKYDKALREMADEQRRATIALGGDAAPICMSGSTVSTDLLLLFSYGGLETPMPCTCDGTVCLRSHLVVDSGAGGYSPSTAPEDDGWG